VADRTANASNIEGGSIVFMGQDNGKLLRVRGLGREGIRIGGPASVEIDGCFIDVTGIQPDHTDALQVYTPGAGSNYTITLRNSDYWPERNSDFDAWTGAATFIESMGYQVVWVPDMDGATPHPAFDAATWDIDIRAALYEGAALNLGVSNGPVALMAMLNCRYLIFKMVTDGCPSTSVDFLKSHGLVPGSSYNERGRLVWENDTEEVLIREISLELKTLARKAA
jgi:hypothetical protein